MRILQDFEKKSHENFYQTCKFLDPNIFFIKYTKIFTMEGALFLDIDQETLNHNLEFLIKMVDIKLFSAIINKIPSYIEKLVNSFLEQSYGNKIFTKLIYFFTVDFFQTKIRM